MSKPLTFEEIKTGEHFISFPSDGDDSGHGGYRGSSRVFQKLLDVHDPMIVPCNVVAIRTKVLSYMPLKMRVLRVLV